MFGLSETKELDQILNKIDAQKPTIISRTDRSDFFKLFLTTALFRATLANRILVRARAAIKYLNHCFLFIGLGRKKLLRACVVPESCVAACCRMLSGFRMSDAATSSAVRCQCGCC